MTEDTIALAAGFPAVERSQWHTLVAAALARSRGEVDPGEVERLLATPTDDGFSVQPLYTRADTAAVPVPAAPGTGDFRRGATAAGGSGWSVRQRHWTHEDDLGRAIAADLGGGADSLWLTGGDAAVVAAVLTDVDLSAVPVVVEGFADGPELARALLRTAGGAALHPATSLGLDPLGLLAGTGRMGHVDDIMDLAGEARDAGIRAFTIDGSIYHEAGGSFGEELACGTAAGLATLRLLVDAGMPVDAAAALIEFRWVVSADQFASLAKLRAARLLWARVLQIAGAAPATGQSQHAVTSTAMLTARDPWVNLIRNTVAAFAGGTGGAAAVTVLPHTLATAEVDEFAQRLARNTQQLLLAEAHVGEVADPAGGSYYVEVLTERLAEAAWAQLREIEGLGGMRAALESGSVAARLERTWQLRSERLARREDPLTGVSEFPDRERFATIPQPWARPGGGLPQHRYSEDFERLRDRADAAAHEPVVTLIALGPLARSTARETFAANLFAAGGVATQTVPFTPGEPLDLPTPTPVACLVGADRDYAELVAPAAAAARAAGVTRLWLAGKPGARGDADAAAGVDGHLHVGSNVHAVLEQTLSDLEVPA